MKLGTVLRDGREVFGAIIDEAFFDFSPYIRGHADLKGILHFSTSDISAICDQVKAEDRIDLTRNMLRAPIPAPSKYLALGGNYQSHLKEAQAKGLIRGKEQVWFNKQVSCVNAPYGDILKPSGSDQLDYEGELGLVISKECRKVKAEDAWDFVAGYVVCNDISVRDWQMKAPTATLGKSYDSHGPFGPWIVTRNEIPNPHALQLTVFVNGEVRQSASTSEMIHYVPQLIEELSHHFTLQQGDILSTGTPAGVGGLLNPPRYLKIGDVVKVEISKIGYIENTVVEER